MSELLFWFWVLVLWVVSLWFVLLITCEIKSFRWMGAIRRIRFSLATLLAVTATISIALGIDRLQQQTNSFLSLPFPIVLLSCALTLGATLAIAQEFRLWHRSPSTLDRYRDRQNPNLSTVVESDQPVETAPASEKTRTKWWLRRMPNRFRSISHRDSQTTPPSGFYNRDG